MYVNSEEMSQATVVCANSEGEILADFTEPFAPSKLTGESSIITRKKAYGSAEET